MDFVIIEGVIKNTPKSTVIRRVDAIHIVKTSEEADKLLMDINKRDVNFLILDIYIGKVEIDTLALINIIMNLR